MPRESFQPQSCAFDRGRPVRTESGRGFRVVLGLVLGAVSSVAQHLPVARLNTIFPPGGQRGSDVLVTVAGSDLDDLAGLRFSDPRIRAEVTPTNAQVFRVTLPADLAPGVVDLRTFGRFGVSNPRGFCVGTGPEQVSTGTNTTVARAQSLPVGAVVNGRLAANQAAWYRVETLPGRAYTIRAETRGIDSRLEPILELADPTGRPLGMSRRGVLGFVGPTNGPVMVSVHDVTYRGGDDVLYRMEVTTAPRVERVLPVVLQSGATNRVTLWGWNLAGGDRVAGTGGGWTRPGARRGGPRGPGGRSRDRGGGVSATGRGVGVPEHLPVALGPLERGLQSRLVPADAPSGGDRTAARSGGGHPAGGVLRDLSRSW
ncbi:MAG: hypothetical protein ACKPGI_12195 [Verrucomicrobiota bacterium]